MADDERATIINVTVLAQLLMLTRQRIEALVKEGWIKKQGVGKYSLVDAVQGYIRFLRDETRRHNVSAADSRVRDARAKDIEVRTMQRLGQLVPLEVYDEMLDRTAGLVRSEFAGLAAACTRDLVMRRIIEREVNARLRRIAESALAELRLAAVGGTDDAQRADGARHLGSEQSDVPANGSGPRS